MPHPITVSTPAAYWPKAAASAALFRDDGMVLIGLRGKDPRRKVWSLPGGHIEPGETARDAALREVHEETGVTGELLGLVDVNDVILRDDDGSLRAHYLLTIFYGRWLSGKPVPGDDCVAAKFVTIDELMDMETTKQLSSFITAAHAKWRADRDAGT